jgi:hypothetical protein
MNRNEALGIHLELCGVIWAILASLEKDTIGSIIGFTLMISGFIFLMFLSEDVK